MLSPSLRQVAHALLTRPPLTCIYASRRINIYSFVRLECVKHAASVHPEPGSNSLNIVSNRQISPPLKSYSELFFLASYFLYFVFKVLLTRFLVFFVVVLFSKTVSPSLPRRLDQYITLLLSCQPLFLNFFKKLKECAFQLSVCAALLTVCSRSTAVVTAPTPPGTGVAAATLSRAAA